MKKLTNICKKLYRNKINSCLVKLPKKKTNMIVIMIKVRLRKLKRREESKNWISIQHKKKKISGLISIEDFITFF